MYGKDLNILINTMMILSIIGIILGIWKFIEIGIWIYHHVGVIIT